MNGVNNVNGFTYEIHVTTMVDPVTGWFECQQLYGTPSAYRCQQILDTVWLARYPRPKEIGMDNGTEFKGMFSQLYTNMGMTPHRTNSWNPQANAVLERIHQVLGDGLQAFDLEGTEIDPEEDDPFNEYLAAVSYAICSAFHQTHGYLPSQMVFGRDMFLDASAEINWDKIRRRKQKKIAESNRKENRNRTDHTYSVGDLILIKKPGILRTLSIPYKGPFKVVKHHQNGSITYERSLNCNKNVNIRRVHPFIQQPQAET